MATSLWSHQTTKVRQKWKLSEIIEQIRYKILRNPLVPAIKFNIIYLFHGMIVDLYRNSSEPSRLSYHQPQARLQPLPNYPPKHSIPVAIWAPCGRSAMLWQAAKPGGSLSWEECAPWTDSQNGLICVWSAHALAFTIVFILLSRMLVGVSNHTRILKVLEFCLHCQSRMCSNQLPQE